MSEDEEKDIDLQIDILKAQLKWDWLLTRIVILVGALVSISVAEVIPHEIRFIALPLLTGTLLVFWSHWSDWPDNKAKELREKYLKEREQDKEID